MNLASTNFLNGRDSANNPPGLISRAIIMAAFYTATALTEAVLWMISPSRKSSNDILVAQPSPVEGSKPKRPRTGTASNVVDFQRYKLFNSRHR
jgi:hypothetical protein